MKNNVPKDFSMFISRVRIVRNRNEQCILVWISERRWHTECYLSSLLMTVPCTSVLMTRQVGTVMDSSYWLPENCEHLMNELWNPHIGSQCPHDPMLDPFLTKSKKCTYVLINSPDTHSVQEAVPSALWDTKTARTQPFHQEVHNTL